MAKMNTLPVAGFHLLDEPIETISLDLSRQLCTQHPETGGIVTFEGRVRNHHQGKAVDFLEYSAYPLLAQTEGEGISTQALREFNLDWAWIIHRRGSLEIGAMAVWVSAGSAHRDEAFAASRYMIDQVKLRLPVWKHEYYKDGSHDWVYCAQHA
jgi:molybdopterin synthase catalytic subunit